MHRIFRLLLLILSAVIWLSWPQATDAKTGAVRQFTSEGSRLSAWQLPASLRASQPSIATGDIDGDGNLESVLGSGPKMKPEVFVTSTSGSIQKRWSVLDGKFRGGINVAVGDLDGDGKAEIIIAPREGGGSTVGIYTGEGVLITNFRAYASTFRGGVEVAIGDVTGTGTPEILTLAGGESSAHIRRFTSAGVFRGSFFPFGKTWSKGATFAAGNVLDYNHGDEIVVAPRGENLPRITVFSGVGKTLKSVMVFAKTNDQGVTLATLQADSDAEQEIAVSPRHRRGDIKLIDGSGALVSTVTRAAGADFRGTVQVAGWNNEELLVLPIVDTAGIPSDQSHFIDINLATQTMRYYQYGDLVGTEKISSGLRGMDTPQGTFKTRNKIRTAYSKPYNLYMDYWMAFSSDGRYGMHALPFWKTSNGRIYEGAAHLGTPVSHGCVRVSQAGAAKLYSWAKVGTPVRIH